MSCWTKEQLEDLLYAVVDELDLSDTMIEKHGPMGTEPHILVREVLAMKDRQIQMLKLGLKETGVEE